MSAVDHDLVLRRRAADAECKRHPERAGEAEEDPDGPDPRPRDTRLLSSAHLGIHRLVPNRGHTQN
jgi:hypothetical protein